MVSQNSLMFAPGNPGNKPFPSGNLLALVLQISFSRDNFHCCGMIGTRAFVFCFISVYGKRNE